MPTIADVITFAEQRRPGLRKELVPATDAQIAELSRLAGHPLPDRFLETLRIMGMRVGPLRLADADFDVQALIARYDVNEPEHDRRFVLLAIDRGEMYLDYYLDCRGEGQEDGPVVRFDYEATHPSVQALYGSLHEMVHTSVFRDFAVNSREHHCDGLVVTDRPGELLSTWQDALSKLGFRAPLAGAPSLRTVERADAAVLARAWPGENHVSYAVGADLKAEMARLREVLLDTAQPAERGR